MNDKVRIILDEVGKVIRGKDKTIEMAMTAILAKWTYSDRRCTGCRKDNTGGCFFPCHGTDRETTAVYTGCTAK